jgi:hypothetical protein
MNCWRIMKPIPAKKQSETGCNAEQTPIIVEVDSDIVGFCYMRSHRGDAIFRNFKACVCRRNVV